MGFKIKFFKEIFKIICCEKLGDIERRKINWPCHGYMENLFLEQVLIPIFLNSYNWISVCVKKNIFMIQNKEGFFIQENLD